MKKEKIFSKFNTRTFNNELEEVLSHKPFSEDVKSNLLSMIYKIEESYDDYEIVKREVEEKKSFLEKILKSIKQYCDSIQIIMPNETNGQKYVIDYKNGAIKTIPNNNWMLYSIIKIMKKNINYKNELDVIEKKPLYDMLFEGYSINYAEVVRDFNGWSWVTSIEEIENINANLIYQNLLLLLNNEIIKSYMQNIIKNEDDFAQKLENKLKQKYKYETIQKMINILKRISIIKISNSNREYKKIVLDIKQKKQEELNLMENKREFLKEISNIKKANREKILELDKIINDKELLKNEYKLRNSILKNNEKIFSMNYLVEILKEERNKILDKISEINLFMEPKVYIERKEEIKSIIDMIKINEKTHTTNNENIIEMQKLFIECFIQKIDKCLEKDDIINALYEVRYYINLLYKENKYIKDIQKLKPYVKKLEEAIVEKVLKFNLIFNFSDGNELDKNILMCILNTRIIDLQTIYIKIKKEKEELKIEIYDEENELNTTQTISMNYENIKLNKKIKLFI